MKISSIIKKQTTHIIKNSLFKSIFSNNNSTKGHCLINNSSSMFSENQKSTVKESLKSIRDSLNLFNKTKTANTKTSNIQSEMAKLTKEEITIINTFYIYHEKIMISNNKLEALNQFFEVMQKTLSNINPILIVNDPRYYPMLQETINILNSIREIKSLNNMLKMHHIFLDKSSRVYKEFIQICYDKTKEYLDRGKMTDILDIVKQYYQLGFSGYVDELSDGVKEIFIDRLNKIFAVKYPRYALENEELIKTLYFLDKFNELDGEVLGKFYKFFESEVINDISVLDCIEICTFLSYIYSKSLKASDFYTAKNENKEGSRETNFFSAKSDSDKKCSLCKLLFVKIYEKKFKPNTVFISKNVWTEYIDCFIEFKVLNAWILKEYFNNILCIPEKIRNKMLETNYHKYTNKDDEENEENIETFDKEKFDKAFDFKIDSNKNIDKILNDRDRIGLLEKFIEKYNGVDIVDLITVNRRIRSYFDSNIRKKKTLIEKLESDIEFIKMKTKDEVFIDIEFKKELDNLNDSLHNAENELKSLKEQNNYILSYYDIFYNNINAYLRNDTFKFNFNELHIILSELFKNDKLDLYSYQKIVEYVSNNSNKCPQKTLVEFTDLFQQIHIKISSDIDNKIYNKSLVEVKDGEDQDEELKKSAILQQKNQQVLKSMFESKKVLMQQVVNITKKELASIKSKLKKSFFSNELTFPHKLEIILTNINSLSPDFIDEISYKQFIIDLSIYFSSSIESFINKTFDIEEYEIRLKEIRNENNQERQNEVKAIQTKASIYLRELLKVFWILVHYNKFAKVKLNNEFFLKITNSIDIILSYFILEINNFSDLAILNENNKNGNLFLSDLLFKIETDLNTKIEESDSVSEIEEARLKKNEIKSNRKNHLCKVFLNKYELNCLLYSIIYSQRKKNLFEQEFNVKHFNNILVNLNHLLIANFNDFDFVEFKSLVMLSSTSFRIMRSNILEKIFLKILKNADKMNNIDFELIKNNYETLYNQILKSKVDNSLSEDEFINKYNYHVNKMFKYSVDQSQFDMNFLMETLQILDIAFLNKKAENIDDKLLYKVMDQMMKEKQEDKKKYAYKKIM